MTRDEQTRALTRAVLQDYAEGRVGWTQIRHRLGVSDYDLVLLRLGQEGLRLPRADPAHSAFGIARLRQAMAEARTGEFA